MRFAVLASGRGSNLAALLDHAAAGRVGAVPAVVVSDRPDAPALAAARRRGVAAVALPPAQGESRDAHDARVLAALQEYGVQLVALAGYMRIVGPRLVDAFPRRMVNIHPSLLPDYKGLRAVRQALAAGAATAGCSTHFVTGDLDGGPVILQARLRVRPQEAEASLAQRILRLEHLVLPRTVDLLAQGRVAEHEGRVRILPGPSPDSWLERTDLDLVSGAHYGEGF